MLASSGGSEGGGGIHFTQMTQYVSKPNKAIIIPICTYSTNYTEIVPVVAVGKSTPKSDSQNPYICIVG